MFAGIIHSITKLFKKPVLQIKADLKKNTIPLVFGKISEGQIFMKNNSTIPINIEFFTVHLEFDPGKKANSSVGKIKFNELSIPAEIKLLPEEGKSISFYFPVNKLNEIDRLSSFDLAQLENGKYFLVVKGNLSNGEEIEAKPKQLKIAFTA